MSKILLRVWSLGSNRIITTFFYSLILRTCLEKYRGACLSDRLFTKKLIVSLRTWRVMCIVLCFFAPASAFSNNLGFDVITMKNGDIHQGTVAVEKIRLKTVLGDVSVPYHQLSALLVGDKKQSDRLTTRSGEIINGRIQPSEFKIFRVLDVTLPINVTDILTISFASRGIPTSAPHLSPDTIKMVDGSRLLATFSNDNLLIKTKEAVQRVNHKDIHYLDAFLAEDDEQARVQLTLRDGKIIQGQLTTNTIKLKTHYGQALTVALSKVSELRYGVNNAAQETDFSHRWKSKLASHFRDHLVDGSAAPEMIKIPGGVFVRGDAEGDDDEKPTTSVSLKAFAIGVFEVSFDEYDQFCRDTRRELPDDAEWGRGSHPVMNVNWNDALAYTQWLSKKTRKKYRLPSDSEWEYTMRAGSTAKFWWGDKVGIAKANCEGCTSLWDGQQTSPVGKFPANSFGLHDTAGNVFEWVADCWHDKFSEAPTDGSPVNKEGCGKRVIRGGAWSFPPKEIRSANRWRDFPSRRSDDTGFRIARDLP
jgi:formylglycine-generating enzyme required for sulfatase activity